MEKKQAQIEQFEKAIQRFTDVLALPLDKNDTVRDSAIQRFEFCADLSWKTIKTVLEIDHGIACASPKGCLREAFAVAMLPDDPFWQSLFELRNLSAHSYDESIAEDIYTQLPLALTYFKNLLQALK